MRKSHRERPKKVRITVDLSPSSYERLNQLEELVEGETKANVIRQALQLYEYIATRSLDGWSFIATKDGQEEKIAFVGAVPNTTLDNRAEEPVAN